MNILYLGSAYSVHDLKFASYFASNADNHVVFIDGSNNEINRERIEIFRQRNIKLLPSIPIFSLVNFHKTLKAGFRLRSILKEHDIDLVHILQATPNALWVFFVKEPKILTTRGSDILVTLRNIKEQSNRLNLKAFVVFALFKKAIKRFDFFSSTSAAQIDQLLELTKVEKDKVFKIRTGVDINLIKKIDPYQFFSKELCAKRLVFFPRIFTANYNHELELEAIGCLPNKIRESCKFIFVKGFDFDTDYSRQLEKKITAFDKAQCVIFDLLSQEEMWSLYKLAALTVMVPQSDGTPNSALEAMAAHCPLIIGSSNYDKDLFTDTCFKLERDDPKLLADLITKALQNYPDELLKRAYDNLLEKGDRQKEMQKLGNLYERAISE